MMEPYFKSRLDSKAHNVLVHKLPPFFQSLGLSIRLELLKIRGYDFLYLYSVHSIVSGI